MRKNKSLAVSLFFVGMLAVASLACGTSSITGLFATATPTATLTFTPTATFTPSPTSTSTPTPTLTPTPLPAGVKAEVQADGSTLFTDYDNHFQFGIPKDWFVLPLGANDMAQLLDQLSTKNPQLGKYAQAFRQLDPDVIRVIALNEDNKYIYNGFASNLTVTAIKDNVMSKSPLDFVTGALEEAMKQQGAKLVSEAIPAANNANGVEVAAIEIQQTVPTATGAKVQAYSKIVVFQSNGKLIMIQLATPQQFKKVLVPALDEISASIKLLKP
jgi:hypothetical protein